MSWGPILFVTVLVALGALWWVSRQFVRSGLQGVGQPAPATDEIPQNGRIILFFTSEHCGPCKAMTPTIAPLVESGQVLPVDVQRRPDLAQAYGIRGTPTTVVVQDGVIARAEVGYLSPTKVAALLG